MDSNDELERMLVFGSMVDFTKDFKYVRQAWDERLLPLNIFIAFSNLALCLLISWYASAFIRSLWQRFKKKNGN